MGKKKKIEQTREERLNDLTSIERRVETATEMTLIEEECTLDDTVAIISQLVVEFAKKIARQSDITPRQVLCIMTTCMDLSMTLYEEREGKESSD